MGLWLRDWRYTSVGSQNYCDDKKITQKKFDKVRRDYKIIDNVSCAVWTIAGTLFIVALTMM